MAVKLIRRHRLSRTSIVSIFVLFGELSLLLLIAAYFFIFTVLNEQHYAEERLAYRISAANRLILGIEKCTSSIDQYRHDWDSSYLEAYTEGMAELDEEVAEYLSDTSSFTQENIQSVKRLGNFISYQSGITDGFAKDRTEDYNSVQYILTALSMHRSEIYMVLQDDMKTGYADYIETQESSYLHLFICLVFFLVAVIVIGFFFVKYLRKTLNYIAALNSNIRQISHQNWNVPDLGCVSISEFDTISDGINRMKAKLHEFFTAMEEQFKKEKRLAEEQLRIEKQKADMMEAEKTMLKAQVNPHFLFNALHQIGTASLVSGPDTVMNLVEATGKILRYSLYRSDELVPLSDEIEIVKTYVFLERQSTDIAFGFDLDVSPLTEEIPVLPMCIQPVVENSFKHGFQKRQSEDWKLNITCRENGDLLEVRIRDNGYGFDEKEVRSSGGIGIANIRKRLSLQYGRDDLLKINARKGESTEIVILFPTGGAECSDA